MNGSTTIFNNSDLEAQEMGEKIGDLFVRKYFGNGALDDQTKICQFIDGVIGVCKTYAPSLAESWKKPKRIADGVITQERSAKKQKLDLPLDKDLTNEIWFKIFFHLPSKYVLRTICRVSKRFRRIGCDVVIKIDIDNLDSAESCRILQKKISVKSEKSVKLFYRNRIQ